MNTIRISVILPTFNERENVIRLIPRIFREIGKMKGYEAEVIVVDDRSPDGTARAVRKTFGRTVRVIERTRDRGLAAAIITGIMAATGVIVVGMDADGNHDPAYLPQLIGGLSGADMVVGSRFLRGGGMADRGRYFLSLVSNATARILLGFPVWDATSGYYAIRRKSLDALDLPFIYRGYGEYHIRLVRRVQQAGLRITEIPVFYPTRRYGQSKSAIPIMLGTYMTAAITVSFTKHP